MLASTADQGMKRGDVDVDVDVEVEAVAPPGRRRMLSSLLFLTPSTEFLTPLTMQKQARKRSSKPKGYSNRIPDLEFQNDEGREKNKGRGR